jgi:tetratricopeptide (TPR) repeat protein
MTMLAFLLLIILFLVSFLYFSHLNPQEITIFLLPDQSFTASAAIILIGCVLIGLIFGYFIHLYSAGSHLFKSWKKERVEKRGREVSSLYRDGTARLLAGDLKKARELLRRAQEREPSRVDILLALASVHSEEEERQQAVELLLKAKVLEPRSLEVLFRLAATFEELNKDEDAIGVYEEILSFDRENRRALRSLRDLHLRHERWPEALDLQSRLLKVDAGSSRLEDEKRLHLHLRYEATRLLLAAKKPGEAQPALLQIVREAPDFTPARVSLGDAYRLQGRFEEASRTWQEGYRHSGRGVFLARLEELYMDAEDPSPLLSFYRSTLLDKGDDLMLRLFFGKLCLRLEMVDEAMEQLSIVESSGADFSELHLLLAEGHRRRERLDESIGEYQLALGVGNRLAIGYGCDACEERSPEWFSRCPGCGAWGTVSLACRSQIRSARPLELREIHHGER